VDPTQFLTLVHLAQAHRFRGELRAALTWADRAVEANPRLWQGHFERAAILHRTGHLEDAVTALDSAIACGAHQNPNAWLMKGDALIRLGDWSEAQRSFQQATDRFPFLGQAWVGLAVAEVEQGHLAEARAALSTAGQLQDEDGTMAAVRTRIQELESAAGRPQ
jgi:tetratricopeptide (TPR) repeat protein